jgi:hypothetical protein
MLPRKPQGFSFARLHLRDYNSAISFPRFPFPFSLDLFITVHGNGFTRASASP